MVGRGGWQLRWHLSPPDAAAFPMVAVPHLVLSQRRRSTPLPLSLTQQRQHLRPRCVW